MTEFMWSEVIPIECPWKCVQHGVMSIWMFQSLIKSLLMLLFMAYPLMTVQAVVYTPMTMNVVGPGVWI